MSNPKLGLIGVIGEELEKDYWRTLEKVSKIGYKGIEGTEKLLEGNTAANLKRYKDLGLEPITISASKEDLRDNLGKLINNAKALDVPQVTVWWSPCSSKGEILDDAMLYNAAGAKLAKEGIKLCYHNHEQEFKNKFNGVYALDILAEHTDPKALYFKVDIAWVTFGGEDPSKILRKLEGRVPAIHIKDLSTLAERDHFTAVGTGVVKVKEAVQTAIDTGVEWLIVEQDKLRNLNAMDTINLSYMYLKEAGLLSICKSK